MKKTIYLKTEEEVALIKESAQVLGKAHAEVAKLIRPGVKTLELNKVADEYIRDFGGIPSFKGIANKDGDPFPAALCISVGSQVVHGIPGSYPLQEGEIVSIDCGVLLNGFHSDSAYTYAVGQVSAAVQALLDATKGSLYAGIAKVEAGIRIGDIGAEIQHYAESRGFSVIRELVGHGIGRNLHEEPEMPNYGRRGEGKKLAAGTVIAIEPMINLGRKGIVEEKDGWTIRTTDRLPSAHFEHTVVVRKGGSEILTTFEYIEQVLREANLLVTHPA